MPFSPVAVPDVPALTSVHPGTSLACGLSVDGPLWCWGEYPLGTVHGPGVEQPERTFDAVKTGGYHACALDPEGTAWCWGQNAFGQLGDGTQWDRWTAQPVAGAFAFDRLALSLYSACGVTREGGVACWGANPDRRMIPWADTFVLEPTGFEVPARIARVQPGESATCALDDAGQAWCWGRGNAGTLGDGTGQERAVPAAVRQAVPFVDLVMGAGHACGLADGGTAWCWGYNHVGQVGDGTLTTRFTPVPVTGSRPFVAITAGYTHTCALDDEDAAHCWGGNDTGELGTDDFFATPVEVPEPVLDAP
jgi:alpha-tubulin suppressor-like RCC1 family protein